MTVGQARDVADREIALGGKRVMLLREYGDRAGKPVVALHGTPASRLMFSGARSAGRLGLRLIAPDRWGYGGTSAPSTVALAAIAHDIELVADELRVERFAVLGISGGGPYAAALAALLPHRVTALALVAPVGPIAGIELSAFHALCFRFLPRMPGALGLVFRAFRHGLAAAPERAIRVAMWRSPPADHRVMAVHDVRARFIAMFREGLGPGVDGALIDMQVFSRPWAVPLTSITAPSALWIGGDDNNVPMAAAHALAATIPYCQLIELNGRGHLWIALNYDEVLEWLVANQIGDAP